MFKNYKRPSFFVRWFHHFRYEIRTYGWWRGLTYDPYIFFKNILLPHNRINIKTLPRSYCEPEFLILHGMFQILVNFVKDEWDDGKSPYKGHLFDLEEHKTQAYESYSHWECSKEELDEHIQMELSMLDSQNKETQEIWDLYNWWTKTRPSRIDPWNPYEGPEIDFYPSENSTEENPTSVIRTENPDDMPLYEQCSKKRHEIEEAYHKEDEEMLVRLVKIRRYLLS